MSFVVLALRVTGVILGVALIGLGVPLFVMPIPLGLIFIALGLLLLVISSREVAQWVRERRQRHPNFDARLRRFEDGLPRLLQRVLATTRPS